jgi:glutamate 5-kinase
MTKDSSANCGCPPVAGRQALAGAQRLVVKVGSSSLTENDGRLAVQRLGIVVDALAGWLARGSEVVLVTSGAQAAGLDPLGLTGRPKDLAQAQAAASVGQSLLMAEYSKAFARHRRLVGQVLLTSREVVRQATYLNARRALTTLLDNGIVPIVNENDAVATDEIRFGDNDRLAALVAHLVHADGLVLLSDVDGVYTAPPGQPTAQRISRVATADDLSTIQTGGHGSAFGTGGMITKLQAATWAASAGIPALIAAADQVKQVLSGEVVDVGTVFEVTGQVLKPKRLWLGYAAQPRGKIMVDWGASKAVTKGKKSLLPVGVTEVTGNFGPGDVVEVVDPNGKMIARGLIGYSATELRAVQGLALPVIATILGADRAVEAIHRDELVTHARARRPAAAAPPVPPPLR